MRNIMYEQVSFDFQMSNISLTPIICPTTQTIIAYELNDCIKKDLTYYAVDNYFSVESLFKFFMLKYKAVSIIQFSFHLTLPMKLLTDIESVNKIISLPHNDQLSLVIQNIENINTMSADERGKARDTILALHNTGWKIWFENIKNEHFDFIKNLCITDFGVKIEEDELYDNEHGLMSIKEKMPGETITFISKKNKTSNTPLKQGYYHKSQQQLQLNENIECLTLQIEDKTIPLKSPTVKKVTVSSNIKNYYMLSPLIYILGEAIKKSFNEPVVISEIEKESNEPGDISIHEITESTILYNCLTNRQSVLKKSPTCNIFILPKDTIITLPCMLHTAVINANENIEDVFKKLKKAVKNNTGTNTNNEFTGEKCKHQQQCRRSFLLPIEHKVISTFSITKNLNETARLLLISPKRASQYKRNAMRKLNIDNNSDLLKFIKDNF